MYSTEDLKHSNNRIKQMKYLHFLYITFNLFFYILIFNFLDNIDLFFNKARIAEGLGFSIMALINGV